MQGEAPDDRVSAPWRVLAAVVMLGLLWQLQQPLLLLFGAVLAALALRALARPLSRHGALKMRHAVLLATLVLTLAIAAALWLLGGPLSTQFEELRSQLPQSWRAAERWLRERPFGPRILDSLQDGDSMPWDGIAGMAMRTANAASGLLLIVLIGIYLALDAGLYRDGMVRLVPPRRRGLARDALDATGDALTRWLLGQAVMMVVVGVVVTVGLSLLGVPLALALGVIAGVLEFVPFFGPIVSGLLAVLVAFSLGPQQALYVALLFVVVQQLEGNVLMPLVQRWAVHLPPALTVAGVVVFGSLFGIPGIVFGTPLTVVTMVLVKRLYVEHLLERAPTHDDA
jgi:predicted PurR-regulated permease PerM